MTRNRSINKNLKRKATPVGAFTAGLPVAKLNSFGRVSVGLTTCNYKIYVEVTLEIIVFALQSTYCHWWFHRWAIPHHWLGFHEAAAGWFGQTRRDLDKKIESKLQGCN